MKAITRISAALLSIVMINATGIEEAFAACTTYSSCYLSCIDEYPGGKVTWLGPSYAETVAVDTRGIALKHRAG